MDPNQGPRYMGPNYHPGFDDDPPRGRMVPIGTWEKPWWMKEASKMFDSYRVKFTRPDGTTAWLGEAGAGATDEAHSPAMSLQAAEHAADERNRFHGKSGYRYEIVKAASPIDADEPEDDYDTPLVPPLEPAQPEEESTR
jgi:hypothetical protein